MSKDMKEKRTRTEIYYDIVKVIAENENGVEPLKITSLQLKSAIAYDKLLKHIKSLEDYKLITTDPFTLTPKGRIFLTFTQCIQSKVKAFNREIFTSNPNANIHMTKSGLLDYEEILKQKQQIINAQAAIITELERVK